MFKENLMGDKTQKEKDEVMTTRGGSYRPKINKIIKDRQDKDKPSNNKYNKAQKAYMASKKKKKKKGILSGISRALGF